MSVSSKVPEDLSWIFDEVKSHSGSLSKAIIAITISNIFQVFSTLFVMAVYNKVIPNESMNTLFSLGTGICVILTFDLLFKMSNQRLQTTTVLKLRKSLAPDFTKRFWHGIYKMSRKRQAKAYSD